MISIFCVPFYVDPAFIMDEAQSGLLKTCILTSGFQMSACLFVYPSNKYLLSTFYIPFTVLDTAGKVKDKSLFPCGTYMFKILHLEGSKTTADGKQL